MFIKSLLLLATVAGATAAAPKSIVDIAVATPDLSTLVTALKAAGLVDTLSGKGPFTVFAPKNEAFAALPKWALDYLLEPKNKQHLVDLLTYHVASGSVHAADLKNREEIPTLLKGKDVEVFFYEKNIYINNGKVTTADVDASNGVVHIIDHVLIPHHSRWLTGEAAPPSSEGSIPLVTFDGAAKTTHKWLEQNDPVMGGRSTGNFTVRNDLGIFDGDVVDVPFLKAPGFIKVTASDNGFPDVSGCDSITINAMTTTPYKGFRLSFGNAHAPGGKFFAYGYKSHFTAPVGKFGDITIPFKSFTDYWDDATGNPIKTCQQDARLCPDLKTLQNMKTISLWGEGIGGKAYLEVKSISATGCK